MAGNATLNSVLVFSGDTSKAVAAVNNLSKSIRALDAKISTLNKTSKNVQTSFSGLSTVAMNFGRQLWSSFERIFDSMRLMSQGIMSVGRAMTFFISMPLAFFFQSATTSAINFEDAMKRVSKTTGLVGAPLDELTNKLRELARRAPTTHEDLAKMAEQAGQLGMESPKQIGQFVEWMEILATSTDIAGDEVVNTMGKIAAAFGWNIDQSVNDIVRLSNVMNKLENTTAASAGEIADALFRFAPQAAQLNIHAADAAALSAALVGLGVSAESAGTRLGTMYIKLTQNADKFADLVKSSDKYVDAAAVRAAIDKDAVEVLGDLIQMMGDADSNAEALANAFDLVGLRGGRALNTLATNQEEFSATLATARKEWVEAASLITEYNRQLESAKSHLQILKNNITDVGVELSNAFIPVINQLVEWLVPALRILIKWLDKMGDTFKLNVVGFTILAVALGPIIFLLSQVAFGFLMFSLGVIKLITSVGTLLFALISLSKALFVLNSASILTIAAFAGIALVIIKQFKPLANKLADWFSKMADSFLQWGTNLAAQLGNGIIAGAVTFVVKAMHYVGNLIARFLKGHSPPKEGPLSHIDQWGKTVFDAYLKGMQLADFGVLKDIGNTIQGILKNLFVVKKIKEKDQFAYLMEARQNLAKLLSIWNKTGKVADDVLNDVVKHLGAAKDEIKELIKANLKYLDIQQKIKDLLAYREELKKSYDAEIRQAATSNASAEDRAEMIRKILRDRSMSMRALDKEEEALESEKDVIKEQLDLQKEMIEAMQDQDDIQAQLLATLEKLAGAAGDISAALGDFSGGIPVPEYDMDDLGDVGAPIIEFQLAVKEKEAFIKSFLAGLTGIFDPIEAFKAGYITEDQLAAAYGIDASQVGKLLEFHDKGEAIRSTWLDLKELWQQVMDMFSSENITRVFQDIKTSAEDAFPGLTGVDFLALSENIAKIGATILIVGASIKYLTPIIGWLMTAFTFLGKNGGIFKTVLNGIGLAIGWIVNQGGIVGVLSGIGTAIMGILSSPIVIAAAIGLAIAALVIWRKDIAAWAKNVWEKLKQTWETVKDNAKLAWLTIKILILKKLLDLNKAIKDKAKSIGESLQNAWKGMIKNAKKKWEDFKKAIKFKINSIKLAILKKLLDLSNSIRDAWNDGWRSIFESSGVDFDEFKKRWEAIGEDIKLIFSTIGQRLATWWSEQWLTFTTRISEEWLNLQNAFSTGWQTFLEMIHWDEIVSALEEGWNRVKEKIEGIPQWFTDRWEEIKTAFSTGWQEFLDLIHWDEIVTAFEQGWADIQTAIDTAKTNFSNAWDEIKNLPETALNAIVTWLVTKHPEIAQGLLDIIAGLQDIMKNGKTRLKIWAINMLYGLWLGINEKITAAIGWFTGLIEDILTAIKNWLGISSPSTVFRDIALDMLQGLWEGIVDTEKVAALVQGAIDAGKAAWQGIREFLGLDGENNLFKGIGTDAVQGFIDGIEGMAQKLIEAAKRLAAKAKAAWDEVFDTDSPSKEMEKRGVWVVEGFINGMESMEGALKRAANELAKPVIAAASRMKDAVQDVANTKLKTPPGVKVAKTGGGAGAGTVALPEMLAAGGLVTKTTLAIIGEGGPEAVIPLDRLPNMLLSFADAIASGGKKTSVIININNPIVREENDLERIKRMVEESLRTASISRSGGVSDIFL